MNKLDRPLEVTDYEADYALWCAEQGALLREGRFDFTGSRKTSPRRSKAWDGASDMRLTAG